MKITQAAPLEQFRVFLRFDNGVSGVADLSALADRGVFAAWLTKGNFNALSISPQGALQWPGELDLCPDALYLQVTGQPVEEVFPAVRQSTLHA